MAAVMAVMGLTGALGNIQVDTFLVRNAKTMLARVMSVGRLASLCALALGPLLGAFLFARFGLERAIFGLLLITVALLVVALAALPSALGTESTAVASPGFAHRRVDEDGQRTRADDDAVASHGGHARPGW
jgi:MFS family permease